MAVIAFDVNETLLDTRALDVVLGAPQVRSTWFALMVHYTFVAGLTGHYVGYPAAQRAALRTLGIGREDEVAEQMRRMPAHADVHAALDRLTDFTVVALTNSPLDVATAGLEYAGIATRFDAILSADHLHALKPQRRVYEYAAAALGVTVSQIRLVAVHGWDIAGALAAGCRAAFVDRPTANLHYSAMALNPLGPQPDIVGTSLVDVADKIVAFHGAVTPPLRTTPETDTQHG
ncbi:haloacid dehalogenase, type II [Mycobacterium simiae]|uniref:Haloacid dehalogenase, type II n=1 Tax=Mycobacterium simiae TaxID=1784 RepID=A0A1X0XIG0_MYCSI|nr:haloacid dehalogenase, type II [Mycobacterium simiae]